MITDDHQFETIMLRLQSADVELVKSAIENCVESNYRRIIPFLIERLSTEEDTNVINVIALGLGKLQADESVPALMKLVMKPELRNKRGSIVYALRNLDCREYFMNFVEMICEGNFEVSSHALDIVESSVDELSYSDKLLAREKLKIQQQIELQKPPGKHPEYDRIHFINDALKALED